MARKALISAEDYAKLSESDKADYKVLEDGRYRFELDDAEDAYAAGLKRSKEEVLADLKRAQAKLKAYDGVDAEEFKKLKQAADEAAAKAAREAGNWEAREKQLVDAHTKEIQKLTEQLAGSDRFIQKLVVTNELRAELGAVAVDVDLALPVFERFVRPKKNETTGEWTAVVVDERGNERIAGASGGVMTIRQFITEAAADKKYAPLMKGSGGSGSGARGSGGTEGDVQTIGANDNKAFIDNLADIAKGKVVVAAG